MRPSPSRSVCDTGMLHAPMLCQSDPTGHRYAEHTPIEQAPASETTHGTQRRCAAASASTPTSRPVPYSSQCPLNPYVHRIHSTRGTLTQVPRVHPTCRGYGPVCAAVLRQLAQGLRQIPTAGGALWLSRVGLLLLLLWSSPQTQMGHPHPE